LPELVGCRGFLPELIGGSHYDKGRAGYKVAAPQKPENIGFRDEVTTFVSELDGQLSEGTIQARRAPFRAPARALNSGCGSNRGLSRRAVFQYRFAETAIEIVLAIEGWPRHADLFQRSFHRLVRLLDQPDDLKLFGCGRPHSISSPPAITFF